VSPTCQALDHNTLVNTTSQVENIIFSIAREGSIRLSLLVSQTDQASTQLVG